MPKAKNKENYYCFRLNSSTTQGGFFRIYQSRNGAIQLALGNVVTELTQQQLTQLNLESTLYELEEFNHVDFLRHYSLPQVISEFIHPDIQAGLETLDDQQPYNYKIKQTSAEPENFELYIWEADADQTYNYENREDAENDVRMAAKHYNLELINFSALPSVG